MLCIEQFSRLLCQRVSFLQYRRSQFERRTDSVNFEATKGILVVNKSNRSCIESLEELRLLSQAHWIKVLESTRKPRCLYLKRRHVESFAYARACMT